MRISGPFPTRQGRLRVCFPEPRLSASQRPSGARMRQSLKGAKRTAAPDLPALLLIAAGEFTVRPALNQAPGGQSQTAKKTYAQREWNRERENVPASNSYWCDHCHRKPDSDERASEAFEKAPPCSVWASY